MIIIYLIGTALFLFPFPAQSHNVALCVTGQLSRLELDSKIKQFILPNIARGHKIHLFMSMYKHSSNRVNSEADQVQKSPNMLVNSRGQTDIDFLNASTVKRRTNAKPLVYNVSQLVAISGAYKYDVTVDLNKNRMDFHQIHKRVASLGADKGKKIDPLVRENLHMSQWINTRRCMELIEQQEVAQRSYFDVVVRMRDDVFVFEPMILPDDATDFLITPKCFTWNGLNDAIYIIGRRWASQFFRSFAEDYYINYNQLHPENTKFNGNPEHWALHHADKYAIPRRHASMCEIPALQLIRTAHGFAPKKSHLDGLCALSRDCQRNNTPYLQLNFIDFGPDAGFCFPDKVATCPKFEKRITNFFLTSAAVGSRLNKEPEIVKLLVK